MENLTTDILELYGFKLAESSTGQGGDTYIRDGVRISVLDDGEMVYEDVPRLGIETVDELKAVYRKQTSREMGMLT